jgi:predicted ATPase
LAQWLGAGARLPLLYWKTEGNPFFVRELAHSLMRSGALRQDEAGRWRLAVAEITAAHVSESLRELTHASLRRAPERAQKLLGLLAVRGRSCELAVLKEIVRQREEKILDDLDTLRRVGLIVERQGRYQFYHELVRHVLYEELSADRKRLWHRQIGAALEELYPHELDTLAGELAEHFERAQAWSQAIVYAQRAGVQAQQAYAYGEARNFLAKALGFFKHLEARSSLSKDLKRLKLELLNRYTGRGVFPTVADTKPALAELQTAVAEMLDLATELRDETQLCEAYQRRARLEIAQGRWEAVRAARRQALDLGYQ